LATFGAIAAPAKRMPTPIAMALKAENPSFTVFASPDKSWGQLMLGL
jgi:hypothetical protein